MSAGNGNGNLTAKDFRTDQEVRWCPGCGEAEKDRENPVACDQEEERDHR